MRSRQRSISSRFDENIVRSVARVMQLLVAVTPSSRRAATESRIAIRNNRMLYTCRLLYTFVEYFARVSNSALKIFGDNGSKESWGLADRTARIFSRFDYRCFAFRELHRVNASLLKLTNKRGNFRRDPIPLRLVRFSGKRFERSPN